MGKNSRIGPRVECVSSLGGRSRKTNSLNLVSGGIGVLSPISGNIYTKHFHSVLMGSDLNPTVKDNVYTISLFLSIVI